MRKVPGGFTLVELLVVVAIISILAALLLPTLSESIFGARVMVCANTHKQRHLVLMQYFMDSNHRWPDFYSPAPTASVGTYGDPFADVVSQYYALAGQPSPPNGWHVYYNYGVLYHLGYMPEPLLIEDPDFVNAPGVANTIALNHVSVVGKTLLVSKKWPDIHEGVGRGLSNGKLYGSYPVHRERACAAMKTGDVRGGTWITGRTRLATGTWSGYVKRKQNPVIAMCMTGGALHNFGSHQNRVSNATRADGSVTMLAGVAEYRETYFATATGGGGIVHNGFVYWSGYPNIWDWADSVLGVAATP